MPENIEVRIASELWGWKFADPDRHYAIVSDSELATLLEFWFPFSEIEPARRLGTWCDGIVFLQVECLDRTTFSIAGVGYFPYQLAPFETVWHFKHRRDRVPRSVILRLGHVAHEKRQATRSVQHPDDMFRSRPTKNSDWMIAVELTELEN